MTDDRNGGGRHEDVETGEPVAELHDLEVDVSARFLANVRAKIERRSTTNQFAVLFWHMPMVMFLEFVSMVFELISPNEPGGGRR